MGSGGKDSLGNRLKSNYEERQRFYLTRRTPVIVRLDGRAFHTFTRSFTKPFDRTLINAMQYAAGKVAEEMMGCQAYYAQSDEVSFLLTDYATHETQAWFDYNKSKIETIAASVMTAHFNSYLNSVGHPVALLAYFDGRAFNIPKEEVSNAFLWRMRDWERNGLNMLAMEHFSHKQLDGKSCVERHAMLEGKGVSWENLPFDIKYGYFAIRQETGGFNVPKIPFTHWDIENQLQNWTQPNERSSLAPVVSGPFWPVSDD